MRGNLEHFNYTKYCPAFDSHEADYIADQFFEARDVQRAFESLLTGKITRHEFLKFVDLFVDNAHLNYVERERELDGGEHE